MHLFDIGKKEGPIEEIKGRTTSRLIPSRDLSYRIGELREKDLWEAFIGLTMMEPKELS